jgi:2-methylcitrate dehydratase PrpD
MQWAYVVVRQEGYSSSYVMAPGQKGFIRDRLYNSGIIASLLASRGFTGPSEVFEGKFGFFSAYLGLENCKLNLLTKRLG